MDKVLERSVREQIVPMKSEEPVHFTEISEDNEIKTRWAVNSFGSSQLILDFFVPDWLFRIDCAVTRFVQRPAEWKNADDILVGFFNILYYTAIIVNRKIWSPRHLLNRGDCWPHLARQTVGYGRRDSTFRLSRNGCSCGTSV